MAHICFKPAGSCKTCEFYKYDKEEGRMACFENSSDSNKAIQELLYLQELKKSEEKRRAL